MIKYCQTKNNLGVCLENIVGLPGENQEQAEAHITFARYLAQRYFALVGISYLPLSAEPGAIAGSLDKKLGLNLCRRTFADYLGFTQKAFEAGITYPYSGFFRCKDFKDGPIFPYGIYQRGLNFCSSYRRENVFAEELGKELAANRAIYSYQMGKNLYRGPLSRLAKRKR